jgi:hypothetical protein
MSNLLNEFNLKLPQSIKDVREDFIYLNDDRITLKWNENKAKQVKELIEKTNLVETNDIEEISLEQSTSYNTSKQYLNTKFDNFTILEDGDDFIDEESQYMPSFISNKRKQQTKEFEEDIQEEKDYFQVNLTNGLDPGQISDTDDDKHLRKSAKHIVLDVKTIRNTEETLNNELSDDQVIEFKLDPTHDYDTYINRPKFG